MHAHRGGAAPSARAAGREPAVEGSVGDAIPSVVHGTIMEFRPGREPFEAAARRLPAGGEPLRPAGSEVTCARGATGEDGMIPKKPRGGVAALRWTSNAVKRRFLPPPAGFGLVMVLLSPIFAPGAGGVSFGAPAAPGGVVASVADRRLTVVWNAVSGATEYRIAVRPKNDPAPLAWREYTVTSSPWTMDAWAMSGLRYEVRAAARNADGQSAWSGTVTTTAPVLRAAPADAIGTRRFPPPYVVGDTAQVVLTQGPFENRSPWRWFLCDADGYGCDLQPRARPTWAHWLGSETRGKRVQVQVDYDKDGVSYTAQAVLGVVDAAPPAFSRPVAEPAPGCREAAAADGGEGYRGDAFTEDEVLATHLYALQSRWVDLEGLGWDGRTGGAVDSLCDDLLVAAPWGDFALVRRHGTVSYLDGNVPMSEAGRLEGDPHFERHVRPDRFRVADVLLKPRSAERWELFVTHHYFTGECLRFRLSSTAILLAEGRVTISPSWRTIFDADPCLPTRHQGGHKAGGKI